MRWIAYFNIYPFTQDVLELHNAKICFMIANTAGKAVKRTVPLDTFLTKYADDTPNKGTGFVSKSIKQQQYEMAMFREKLRILSPESVRKIQ